MDAILELAENFAIEGRTTKVRPKRKIIPSNNPDAFCNVVRPILEGQKIHREEVLLVQSIVSQLTLYGLSLLMDVHTYIHFHNGQFWSTLKNVPSSHDETLRKYKVHALYLGRGLFVELRERETPQQIIDNPDPKVISIVIGELSELETKTYDDIVHTGLSVGKTPELKAGTSGSGSTSKHGQKPTMDESCDETPLDLSRRKIRTNQTTRSGNSFRPKL